MKCCFAESPIILVRIYHNKANPIISLKLRSFRGSRGQLSILSLNRLIEMFPVSSASKKLEISKINETHQVLAVCMFYAAQFKYKITCKKK